MCSSRPPPPSNDLGRYYAAIDYRLWESPDLYPPEAIILEHLWHLAPGSAILDYGCSSGRLLSRLVGTHHCYGVELNEAAAVAAAGKGLTVIGDERLEQGSLTFDAVVLVDVFEHIDNPTALLLRLSRHLKPGGVLIVGTGNADAAAVAGDPANFWYFQNIAHLCMISKPYAEWFAQLAAFELTDWRETSHYDTTAAVRVRQWAYDVVFGVFHRNRMIWLRPVLSRLPRFRRAAHWKKRPHRDSGRDHVVAMFRSPPGAKS